MSSDIELASRYKYLVMWCNEGLEFIYDLADWERRKVWSTLRDEPLRDNPPDLRNLILRAQFNSQRHYEIYIVESVNITIEDMRSAFEQSPQVMANLIRKRGNKIYSDRATNKAVIV